MVDSPSIVSLQAEALSLGDCDLCGQPRVERHWALVVQLSTGAAVRLMACVHCVRALHRVSAASGGLARFALGEPPTRAATTAAPKASGKKVAKPPELLYEYATSVQNSDGTTYHVRAYGQERADSSWIGWLEFQPERGSGAAWRTGQETSQPNRAALAYWASGLEPVYLEGALERANAA